MITPEFPSRGWAGSWSICSEPPFDAVFCFAVLKKTAHWLISRRAISGHIRIDLSDIVSNPSLVESATGSVRLILPRSIPLHDLDQTLEGALIASERGSVNAMPHVQESLRFRALPGMKDSPRLAILVPIDRKDNRWKSMGIPPAPMILLSLARSKGINANLVPLDLYSQDPLPIGQPDIIAVSLLEDLFPAVRTILGLIRLQFEGPILVGGPMATLAPEIVATHLAEADVILRGDAEAVFIDALERIFNDNVNETSDKKHWPAGCIVRASNGWWVEHLDRIPFTRDLGIPTIDYSSVTAEFASAGLEFSTSRGCPHHCVFCSHVHGRKVRRMPIDRVRAQLEAYHAHVESLNRQSRMPFDAWTVNLNDDDLLADPSRAGTILKVLREVGLKVWGIQTSLRALRLEDQRKRVLETVGTPDLYPGGRPLLWIGTDAFSQDRLKRLQKIHHSVDLDAICRDLDASGISGYHYWIMTDADSDWAEFFNELTILRYLGTRYPATFHVLPNAGTLVPYPSSSIYAQRQKQMPGRVICRMLLEHSRMREFRYPLILHERPLSDYLYALVEPDARCPERLVSKPRDFIRAIRNAEWEKAIGMAIDACRLEIDALRASRASERLDELTILRQRMRELLYM